MNVNDFAGGSGTADGHLVDDGVQSACDGVPAWITPDAVRDTLRVFRPYYGPSLTAGEAVEIMLNVGRSFEVLYGGEMRSAPQREVL